MFRLKLYLGSFIILFDDLYQDTFAVHEVCVRKFFQIGDNVNIISGDKQGSSGMVVKVENNNVVVFFDSSQDQVRHQIL